MLDDTYAASYLPSVWGHKGNSVSELRGPRRALRLSMCTVHRPMRNHLSAMQGQRHCPEAV